MGWCYGFLGSTIVWWWEQRRHSCYFQEAINLHKFDCNKIGNMDKYVGCKVDRNFDDKSIKLTQPVMLQSFVDEFSMC
jgi:hypothetical protein